MSMSNINWYPGHMKKAKDMIKENIDLIDIVLEIVDARIPISSKNPDIEKIIKNKKKIILLNKSDLVEKSHIEKSKQYFINKKLADEVISISATTGNNFNVLYSMIDKIFEEKKKKLISKGLKKVNVRLLVAGIPNVGKSKIINKIVGKNSAKVGNTPGLTRGKQWIKIKDGIELLDSPGILWPKFESEEIGFNLAITGAIKDYILPIEEVAIKFLQIIISKNLWNNIKTKYELDYEPHEPFFHILEEIASKKGLLLKGRALNTELAAFNLLRDYRNCKFGKIMLDNIDI